jgi:hypothetical protein
VVVVLALIAVAMTLFGVWAQASLRQQRQLRHREIELQTHRLAEAGVARARAQLAVNPEFSGETWNIPAEQLGGRHAALVTLDTERPPNRNDAIVQVTAEYPAGATRRVRHTETVVIELKPATRAADPASDSTESGEQP